MDGCIDHGAESIYAEQYTAAIECLAFSFTELTVILEYGLTFIPEESRIAGVVRTCLTWYRDGCTWKESVTELHDTYASNDSSISFYNFGVEILALLYGEGKFEETVLLALSLIHICMPVLCLPIGCIVLESFWRVLFPHLAARLAGKILSQHVCAVEISTVVQVLPSPFYCWTASTPSGRYPVPSFPR